MPQTLHYGKACAVGVAMETAPPTMEQACQVCVHASDTAHIRTMMEALQLSGQVTSFQVPSEIMGSTVKVCLDFITPTVLFSAGSSGAGGGLPCEVRTRLQALGVYI